MRAKIFAAALVLAFLSGCATQTAAVCGGADKVASVERALSPMNWLLNFLTSGIYSPLDARVYCR